MISRRDLIGKAAVGAAAALAVGAAGTAAAATRPFRDSTDPTEAADARDPKSGPVSRTAVAPPAWDLVAPFGAGSVVAHGWHLVEITPVQHGSVVVTLQNERGRSHRIHLCQNDGSPAGLVYTRRVDLVVMNEGYGELPTDEHLGQAVAALAHAIAANETTVAGGVVAELLPHRERVARFAAAEGPAADGKLR